MSASILDALASSPDGCATLAQLEEATGLDRETLLSAISVHVSAGRIRRDERGAGGAWRTTPERGQACQVMLGQSSRAELDDLRRRTGIRSRSAALRYAVHVALEALAPSCSDCAPARGVVCDACRDAIGVR